MQKIEVPVNTRISYRIHKFITIAFRLVLVTAGVHPGVAPVCRTTQHRPHHQQQSRLSKILVVGIDDRIPSVKRFLIFKRFSIAGRSADLRLLRYAEILRSRDSK